MATDKLQHLVDAAHRTHTQPQPAHHDPSAPGTVLPHGHAKDGRNTLQDSQRVDKPGFGKGGK